MISLMESNVDTPVNIGNPNNLTILELAEKIKQKINPKLEIIFKPLPEDDPLQRQPDISKAKKELNWIPNNSFDYGLEQTIDWFKEIL